MDTPEISKDAVPADEALADASYDALSTEDLRRKDCAKWQKHGAEVLPLWVADMDFAIADPIKQAIEAYTGTDNFGYPDAEGLPGLKEAVVARLSGRYGWQVEPDQIHLLNSIVTGLFLGVLAGSSEGDEVLMQSPIYGPFRMAVERTGRVPIYNPLVHDGAHWRIDFEALEALVTPATRVFMLCNPQNPTGRVFTRDELERLAEFALKHRLWVVSDELHSDLVFPGHEHIPFASLSDDIAGRTITLFGPTKTFNIAGLKIGFLVSQNEALLERVKDVAYGLIGAPNVVAQTATIAAYTEADAWLNETLHYLEANRDYVADFVKRELPGVEHTAPEGTYLAWFDFRALGLENPEAFLLEEAGVALNDGAWFGPGGEGFVRLNFATSRHIVTAALERIRDAVRQRATPD